MKVRLFNLLLKVSTLLFIISIPVFLITTDLRLALNNVRLYDYGFDKYNVSLETGIPPEELHEIAVKIINYYNSEEEFIDIAIYGERETLHMKDVKGLVRLDYNLQMISIGYIVLFGLIGFFVKKKEFWRKLVRGVLWGAWFTIAFLIVIGIWAIIDFSALFYIFHLVSFNNNLWQLSQSDQLLLMFPQEFFNEAALFVAGAAIVEAMIIIGVVWGILKFKRHYEVKKPLK